jgi:hypothetical protein
MRDALSNMEKSALARTPSFHAPPIEDFHKTLAKVGLSASSLPLAACAVAVLTYVTCIILTAALGTYTGGLRMPYFSDTGREGAGYWVFAVGLCLAAALNLGTHAAVWNWIIKPQLDATLPPPSLDWTPTKGSTRLRSAAVAGPHLSAASAPFLAILAIFDTSRWPHTHALSAYCFFGLNFVGCWAYVVTFWRILRMEPAVAFAACRRRKLALACVFTVAFFLYLPVGLAVNCAFVRLSVARCVGEGVGTVAWCGARRLSNDPADAADYARTVLWDYSGCVGTNEMRSGAQFVCIVALLLFSADFSLDFSRLDGHAHDQEAEPGAVRARPRPPPAATSFTQGSAIISGRVAARGGGGSKYVI